MVVRYCALPLPYPRGPPRPPPNHPPTTPDRPPIQGRGGGRPRRQQAAARPGGRAVQRQRRERPRRPRVVGAQRQRRPRQVREHAWGPYVHACMGALPMCMHAWGPYVHACMGALCACMHAWGPYIYACMHAYVAAPSMHAGGTPYTAYRCRQYHHALLAPDWAASTELQYCKRALHACAARRLL